MEVIADGAAHQGVALRHETQFTTNGNLATCRFDKTENQPEQCRLADTRLAHDGGLRTWTELMREVGKDLPVALGITERDVVEADSLIMARITRIPVRSESALVCD